MNQHPILSASAADIDLLLKLMAEYYACDNLMFDASRARRGLRVLLEDNSLGGGWLIHDGGEIAGYFFLTFGFSLEFGGRFGLVDELYLRPESRGKGLGRRALAFAENIAAEMGMEALRLEVEHENIAAQRLYRNIGFDAHERYLMTKWIPPPNAAPARELERGDE